MKYHQTKTLTHTVTLAWEENCTPPRDFYSNDDFCPVHVRLTVEDNDTNKMCDRYTLVIFDTDSREFKFKAHLIHDGVCDTYLPYVPNSVEISGRWMHEIKFNITNKLN